MKRCPDAIGAVIIRILQQELIQLGDGAAKLAVVAQGLGAREIGLVERALGGALGDSQADFLVEIGDLLAVISDLRVNPRPARVSPGIIRIEPDGFAEIGGGLRIVARAFVNLGAHQVIDEAGVVRDRRIAIRKRPDEILLLAIGPGPAA